MRAGRTRHDGPGRIGAGSVALAAMLMVWGCGPGETPPAGEPAGAPEPQADMDVQVDPPGGGDIIVDDGGYKQKQGTTTTNISYGADSGGTLWIPQGFTGSIGQVIYDPGSPPQLAIPGSFQLHFPSGAQIQVVPGATSSDDATWNCRASATASWSTCATRNDTTISEKFTVSANNAVGQVLWTQNSQQQQRGLGSGATLTIK